MPKFKIRDGFTVHHEKVITREEAGRTIKQPVVESHYSSETVEMSEEDALKHLHKLEPVCKDSKELFDRKYAENAAIAAARAADGPGPASPESIATAVVKALVDAGAIQIKK